MASITTNAAGERRIQFTDAADCRRTIYLGRRPQRFAETVRARVEAILEARSRGGSLDIDELKWLNEIPDRLHKKLCAVGLVPPRKAADPSRGELIAAFVDRYIGLRTDVKPNTLRAWRQTRDLLAEHFGARRPLAQINALDARGFHAWLSSATKGKPPERRFSAASVSKYTSFARQFFAAAVDARAIPSNPFIGIKLGRRANRARQRFVDRETIGRVLDGCSDPQFRLVIALSRFGGLRVPSELYGLQWQHIDRDRGRILVTSPKTERYEGGATREIPLFPELVPFIDEWFEACPEGREHVVSANRRSEAAWRVRMGKLLKRLGIAAWPRIFHNLRASRQTELEERFPSHVVCRWMGNSEAVAREHYLQTTDDHFRDAAQTDQTTPIRPTQKPTQQRAKRERKGAQEQNPDEPEIGDFAGNFATLRSDAQKPIGSGWESNPPGAFADATPGLKPVAVTRAAYTPGSPEL